MRNFYFSFKGVKFTTATNRHQNIWCSVIKYRVSDHVMSHDAMLSFIVLG